MFGWGVALTQWALFASHAFSDLGVSSSQLKKKRRRLGMQFCAHSKSPYMWCWRERGEEQDACCARVCVWFLFFPLIKGSVLIAWLVWMCAVTHHVGRTSLCMKQIVWIKLNIKVVGVFFLFSRLFFFLLYFVSITFFFFVCSKYSSYIITFCAITS